MSSGCIRLYPEGITDLFPRVPNGAQVNVINQPLKAAWIGDKLYVESHPNVDDTLVLEQKGTLPPTTVSESDLAYVRKIAGVEYEKNLNLAKIKTIIEERKGYPVAVYTKGDTVTSTDVPDESKIEPASAAQTSEEASLSPSVTDAHGATAVPEQNTEKMMLIEKTAVAEGQEPFYRAD